MDNRDLPSALSEDINRILKSTAKLADVKPSEIELISQNPSSYVYTINNRPIILKIFVADSEYYANSRSVHRMLKSLDVTSGVICAPLDEDLNLALSHAAYQLFPKHHQLGDLKMEIKGEHSEFLASKIARTLKSYHSIGGQYFSRLVSAVPSRTWSSYLSSCLAALPDRYAAAGFEFIPAEVLRGMERLEICAGDSRLLDVEPKLTHRDCHLDNMVIDGEGELRLIDLDSSSFHDPLFDLSKIHISHYMRQPDLVTRIENSYCSMTETSRDLFDFRLRVCVLLECLWGYTYHYMHSSESTQRQWRYFLAKAAR